MKTHLTIFGSITFLNQRDDGELKAIVHEIHAHKNITPDEAEKLINNGKFEDYVIPDIYKGEIVYEEDWICTDPDRNQYRKNISDKVFLFREDRIINPITKETEMYETEIDLDDYKREQIFDYCLFFGYDMIEVDYWLYKGINYDLIAKCIFEI
jgi:hypothetical protein